MHCMQQRKRVMEDTIAFDDAIRAALDKVKLNDPTLATP